MSEVFQRPLRIHGRPGNLLGYLMEVTDVSTGQIIQGVTRVVIELDVWKPNIATITYEEMDSGQAVIGQDGKPVVRSAIVQNPEVDVTALETSRLTLGPYELQTIATYQGIAMQVEDKAHHRWELVPSEVLKLYHHIERQIENWRKWATPDEQSGDE